MTILLGLTLGVMKLVKGLHDAMDWVLCIGWPVCFGGLGLLLLRQKQA